MLRKPLLSLLLALLLGGGFVYGLIQLFVLRYEIGDLYQPNSQAEVQSRYSSLRADPLGTKALAEALDALPSVEVRRNFKPLPKLRPAGPITLVYTGVPHHAVWTRPELAAFDSLVVGGSRAVFTFYPVESKPTEKQEKHAGDQERATKKKKVEEERSAAKKKESKKPDQDDSKDEAEDPEMKDYYLDFDAVAKRWGFEFDYLPAEKKAFDRHAGLIEPGGHLESDISWHSALYFRDLKPQWKVLYMCGTMPVIIERKYGDGSIVLVADSFLVSNEALSKERHSRLLARLFSGPPAVVFDEESHGLSDDPGVASLARKYRLHGVVAGLLLLSAFFVWKNAVRFIPPYEPRFAESDVIAGKESGEGFINLLHRSIRPSAIFETCVAEWRKASSRKPKDLAKIEEIFAQEQVRPARERDPVAAYRAISHALARKS